MNDTNKTVEQNVLNDYESLKQFLKETGSVLSCKDFSIYEADYKVIVTVNLKAEINREF